VVRQLLPQTQRKIKSLCSCHAVASAEMLHIFGWPVAILSSEPWITPKVAPSLHNMFVRHVVILLLVGIRKQDGGMIYDNTNFICEDMKISQLVQKLKGGKPKTHTHTQHGNGIGTLLLF
jgi:hypothetical protein